MSIILRTLKGSALTYEEMDRNLSQYFYSSSVHDSGTELRLHYTGSDTLDTPGDDYGPDRYHSITIGSGGSIGGVTKITAGTGVTISPASGTGNVTINATGAAGNNPGGSNGSIQFNNSSAFGGNTDLFYSSTNYRVGLGTTTPETKFHIAGSTNRGNAVIRLAGIDGAEKAQVEFYEGTTALGRIGRTLTGTDDSIFINAKTRLNFSINSEDTTVGTVTSKGLGVFDLDPNRQLVVIGTAGIGIQRTGGARGTQSFIKPLETSLRNGDALQGSANPYGLMLSAPLTSENNAGGNIVVSLSEYSSRGPSVPYNSFTIVESTNENYTLATSVATFRSDKKVGIATNNPQTTLHFNGQIRGGSKLDYGDPETNLEFNSYKVIKKVVQTNQTITATAPATSAGTEVTLIIQGQGGSIKTLSFGGTFKVETTLAVGGYNVYTMKFVSDGSYWYETSRTTALS